MNDTPLHSVSVAGVTFDETGRVLLIKRRDNGMWQAPGGVLELGETFEEGVAREVLEETGVEVGVDRLTGVYKNVVRGVVAIVYRCTELGGAAVATEESAESVWVDVASARLLMAPIFSIRVEDAAQPSHIGAASRAHDGLTLL